MADPTTNLDAGILQRNLDALSAAFPMTAGRLQAVRADVPPTVLAATRDGKTNLRLSEGAGPAKWFGRTSIPAVRANALVSQFQAGHANVLLPGIAEGSEAALLLERFGPHRAVFVWEEDPRNLLLAFQLHDFAGAIETRRLVPILAPLSELQTALGETLAALPGHLCPDRMLLWPWHTQGSIAPCRAALEAAYRETEGRRRSALSNLREQLANLPPCPTGGPHSIAVLWVHAQPEIWAWADGMGRAITDSGGRAILVGIRTPADMHPLARSARLATGLQQHPEMVLLLNTCRGELADVLPESIPAISWFDHAAALDENLPKRLGPRDRVAATDSILADRVARLGIDPQRIAIVSPPVVTSEDTVPDWADRPLDVAIVSHRAPTDPHSYGFDLPTHVTVWQAALELIKKALDTFSDHGMPEILDRAERQTRVRIGDAAVRAHMSEVLASPVASSLILQDLLQHLSRAGLRTSCFGQGWGDKAAPPPAGPADRLRIYLQAKSALFASPTGIVPSDVLIAAAAGAAVTWRAHPRDRQPGGFATLLAPRTQSIVFDRNQAAPAPVGRLLASADQWRKLVTAARDRCKSDHSPQAALAHLRAAASSCPAEFPT